MRHRVPVDSARGGSNKSLDYRCAPSTLVCQYLDVAGTVAGMLDYLHYCLVESLCSTVAIEFDAGYCVTAPSPRPVLLGACHAYVHVYI